MSDIIIGIHGLGNKPARSTLTDWWRKSIIDGLGPADSNRPALPFEMVYWADVLYMNPLDPEATDPEDPQFLQEPYQAPNVGVVSSEHRSAFLAYLEEQMDRLFLNEDLTLNYSRITDLLIHRFFRDLETYIQPETGDASARRAIQNRLIDSLQAHRDDRIMLIAHSMGSIVAYDVLSSLAPAVPIDTLITIGSPLGLPQVVSRIYAAQHQQNPRQKGLRAPECITGKWINMTDLEDRVALDRTLADDYLPNSKGIQAQGVEITNDYMVNGERNPHKSFGYLRTPEIARLIDEFLTSEPVRPLPRILRWWRNIARKMFSRESVVTDLIR